MNFEDKQECPWCGSEITHAKFLEIEAKIRLDEKRKFEAAKATMKAQLERQHLGEVQEARQSAAKQAEQTSAKAVREANALRLAAEKNLSIVRAEAEANAKKGVDQARQVFAREQDAALLRQKSEFNRERESLQKKLQEVERRLEKKTANELGDGAEIDLYEALREAFNDDRIKRVPKGVNGADIVHEILYKGRVCGKIITDCKHRLAWQNSYVSKLRQDQLSAGADHAILSSGVFPSGHREMCVISEIIIVSPARVVHITSLLRKALVTMHLRGLSQDQRKSKMSSLYDYITSEGFAQQFTETQSITKQILEIDVQEKKEHDKTWRQRGALARRLTDTLRELDTDIAAIVEGEVESAASSQKTPNGTSMSEVLGISYGT